jgi:hypothetical protein
MTLRLFIFDLKNKKNRVIIFIAKRFKMKWKNYVWFFFSLLLWSGCQKELIFQPGQIEDINFSVDTLLFDTVFTELGSL